MENKNKTNIYKMNTIKVDVDDFYCCITINMKIYEKLKKKLTKDYDIVLYFISKEYQNDFLNWTDKYDKE